MANYFYLIEPKLFSILQIQKVFKSKLELLQEYIARILNIVKEKVDIFSVQLYQKSPPMTDIHFSARSSTYFKPERLNGIILFHREKVLLL